MYRMLHCPAPSPPASELQIAPRVIVANRPFQIVSYSFPGFSAQLQQPSQPFRFVIMGLSILEGFIKSTAMTIVSEIGDKTFFVAALMAMRHSRRLVLAGALGALVVMTTLSAFLGWAAPNLISRELTHNLATVLFFAFGLRSLWDGFTEKNGESSELAEVEAKLDDDQKQRKSVVSNVDDDLKKQKKKLLTSVFHPILLEAFSLTFFGEWGDRSQIATIGLAAEESVVGVALGGILAQALCTGAAVWGGKHLASRISERAVAFCGGSVFVIFGIHSLLAGVHTNS